MPNNDKKINDSSWLTKIHEGLIKFKKAFITAMKPRKILTQI